MQLHVLLEAETLDWSIMKIQCCVHKKTRYVLSYYFMVFFTNSNYITTITSLKRCPFSKFRRREPQMKGENIPMGMKML